MTRRFRSGKRSKESSGKPERSVASGRIDRLASDGSGVMRRADGKVTFVPFCLPGEAISCEVHTEKKTYARARLSSLDSPSPLRIAAVCPHFTQCGGCQIQHIAPESHGEIKRQWFKETCQRIGRWPEDAVGVLNEVVQVHQLAPLRYRQRARFHLEKPSRGEKRLGVESQRVCLGFRAEDPAEDMVDLEMGCPILVPEIEQALGPLRRAAERHLVPGSRLQAEVTRHWLLESASPALALTLFKDDRTREQVDEQLLVHFLNTLAPHGFFHPPGDLLRVSDSRLALSEGAQGLAKASVLVHRLGFLQPHEQASSLYRSLSASVARSLAKEMLGEGQKKNSESIGRSASPVRIWDLYGGCGLLSHDAQQEFAALGGQTHTVVVEQSSASLQAAREWRSSSPHAPGQTFETRQMNTLGFLNLDHQPTDLPALIIADPPRSGLGVDTCSALIRLCRSGGAARDSAAKARSVKSPEASPVRRLVLVFCDPAACARDTAHFLSEGFRIGAVHLVDAFPQTHHYEVIVELSLEMGQCELPRPLVAMPK